MKRTFNYSVAIERRLLSTFYSASSDERTSGLNWYAHAREIALDIAGKHSLEVGQVVGVTAALSPGLEWDLNITQAEDLIRAWVLRLELPKVGVYGKANVKKAKRILTGELPEKVLGGRKVLAFFHAIMGNGESVVVDRHTLSAAYGENADEKTNQKFAGSSPWYRLLARQYARAAAKAEVAPADFQAVIWVVWRNRKAQA